MKEVEITTAERERRGEGEEESKKGTRSGSLGSNRRDLKAIYRPRSTEGAGLEERATDTGITSDPGLLS